MFLKPRPASAVVFSVAAVLAVSAGSRPIDEEAYRLASQIRKRIVTLDNYGVFDNIVFSMRSVEGGYDIILRGQASRPALQNSAENAVDKIEGVVSVTNNIEVLPGSRLDEDVRAATYAKIYGSSVLSRYDPHRGTPIYGFRRAANFGISSEPPIGPHPIHIIVKNGNVTLEGVVDSESDKTIAEVQANSVNGVFSVTNHLEVLRDKARKN